MSNDFPDYPGLGLTDDKVTVSYNRFDVDASTFRGEQTVVLQKSDLLAQGIQQGFDNRNFYHVVFSGAASAFRRCRRRSISSAR